MAGSLFDISPLEPLIRDGFVLLTPNQRLARRIKTEWDRLQANSGAGAWPWLPVYPVEQWLQQRWRDAVEAGLLPPRLLLSPGQALQLWRQVIEEQMRDGHYHLLRAEDAAELAAGARDTLYRWRVDWSAGAIRAEFERDPDCRVFLEWLEAFEAILARDGQTTVVNCLEELLRLDAHPVSPGVVLVECDDLPPLVQASLQHLAQTIEVPPVNAPAADSLLHPFPDRRAELHGVARWAASRVRQAPDETLGIVLGGSPGDSVALEYLLRREFDCLGDDYESLPVNFSTGIPLAHTPLVRDALGVLSLGLHKVDVPRLAQLIQSRYLDLPDRDTALVQRFIQRLYERGSQHVEVSEVRYQAGEISLGNHKGIKLGQCLLDMYRIPELRERATASEWASRFSRVLKLWGWPGLGLDSLEYQQAELWSRTLESYRGFDAVCGKIDYGTALNLLRDTCQRQVSHPQTVEAGVHVLGSLEAAGLSFDHLWLVGMQASSWPAPARPHPLLPTSLQVRYGTPHATAEREWSYSRGRLLQYLRCSGTVHASYSRQIDGVPDLKSPLLVSPLVPDQQCFNEELPGEPSPVFEAWTSLRERRQIDLVEDGQAPPVATDDAVVGGSGIIEDQSHCPFRAFGRRRLRVEPLGEFRVALSPADRGTLLHGALNALWAELHDYSGLAALEPAAEKALVQKSVEAAVHAERARMGFSPGPAYWDLEQERLAGLLAQWLAVERRRSDFVVGAREEAVELELGRMQLRLRVDRIDQLPDGSRVTIDYKSSVSRVADWMGERPRKPQLLLYGIAQPDNHAALAFAQVRRDDCRFVGLGDVEVAPGIRADVSAAEKAGMDVQDWEGLNERWRENLERLADDFVTGRAEVDPLDENSCRYCGLDPLCRVARDDTPQRGKA